MSKVVSMPHIKPAPVEETVKGAMILEKRKEWKQAAELYEKLLKQSATNLKVLGRLMMVYRKLKDTKKEIAAIDKSIDIHEQQYLRLMKPGPKISQISKKLNSLLGHTDKKGKNIFLSTEVSKLQKRKENLLKKL
jgi:tetratricopeptide (TPR) repeat protein